MLTEGDRVEVARGDFAGTLGTVVTAGCVDGLAEVELDTVGRAYFSPSQLYVTVINTHDPVEAPSHYRAHPSGIECIQITEHMSFNLGNATKYIWRADLKGDAIEDLRKADWYINREIEKREATS